MKAKLEKPNIHDFVYGRTFDEKAFAQANRDYYDSKLEPFIFMAAVIVCIVGAILFIIMR